MLNEAHRRVVLVSGAPRDCVCQAQVVMRRYAARSATSHPVHVITSLTPGMLVRYDRPVGLGAVIDVDTTGLVDVAALAREVRTRLAVPG